MKPIFQTITKHDPDNGQYGDCFRACIASALYLNIEDVPHFADNNASFPKAMLICQDFLRKYNLALMIGVYKTDSAHKVIDHLKWEASQVRDEITFLIGGISPRGHSHVVLANTDGAFHDPHPDTKGAREIQLKPYEGLNGERYFTVDRFVALNCGLQVEITGLYDAVKEAALEENNSIVDLRQID